MNEAGQEVLKLKTPWRDEATHQVMIPLEFMQKLAVLVPRPRLHLIRFQGVLAPNAKLRAQVVLQDCDQAQEPKAKEPEAKQTEEGEGQRDQDRPLRLGWARLLKRVFNLDLENCPNCVQTPLANPPIR